MTNLALKLEPAETALTFVEDGLVLTNSKTVSAVFNKRHCDVLEAIKRLEIPEDLRKRNFPLTFNEVKMPNGAIRKDPCYNLTKDGFVLLVMGFTGKKAMEFKIKYIEAFNAMERALEAQPAAAAKPVTVQEHTRALPSGKKEIVLSEKAKQEIGGIVKACASKAIKDELAVLPAPSFNPQALKTAIESEVTNFEHRRCIGMAVTPQEKQLIELIRQDYYIAVGKVYRAALDAVEQG